VTLPSGASFFVTDDSGRRRGPYSREIIKPSGVWLPSVRGETVRIQVVAPPEAWPLDAIAQFEIDRVMELIDHTTLTNLSCVFSPGGQPETCYSDASCLDTTGNPLFAGLKTAVAIYYLFDGTLCHQCSGGLVTGFLFAIRAVVVQNERLSPECRFNVLSSGDLALNLSSAASRWRRRASYPRLLFQ
jgi:hypothetical protein